MRKKSCFLFLSIFVLISSVSPRESLCAESTKVIIGMDAPTLSDLPLSVALKKDFYKTEGLNVLQMLFRSGPTAMQALVSGSIQFSTGFGTGTRAAMAGAPTQGKIGYRHEQLGTSDRGVILLRKLLMEAIETVQKGGVPQGIVAKDKEQEIIILDAFHRILPKSEVAELLRPI
jgi:hypothetical protein